MKLKKNPKVNLEHFSGVFTLIGLVLSLYIVFIFIEHKSYAMIKPNELPTTIKMPEEETKTVLFTRIKKQPQKIEQPITTEAPVEKPTKPVKVIDPNNIKKVVNKTELIESPIAATDENSKTTDKDFSDVKFSDYEPENLEPETIPFTTVENIPVYPGCEKFIYDKEKSTKCFNKKISKLFNKEFDTEIASDLNLTGIQKINCQFIIDANGNISPEIKTSSKTHPDLAKEVRDVLKKIPKMMPAKQNGKAVNLIYSLPFRFRVE